MNRIFIHLLTGLLVLGLLACAQPVAGEVVKSEKRRVTNPSTSQADLSELVSGNTAFAFDLYQLINADDENIFYSPYSISAALAMVYAGARGTTEQQMNQALHFNLPQERLHPAFNSLDIELNKRGDMIFHMIQR